MPIIGGRQIGVRGLGFQGAGKPSVPTSVSATDVGTSRAYNNGATNVTWVAPSSNGAPITSYTVLSSPGGYSATTSSTSVQITGLQSGVSYTYSVTATNAVGTSDAGTSSAVTATTVPQAPTVTAANVGTGRAYNNGAATITATGGATGGKTILSYAATSSPSSFTASGSSPVTVTGLASATAYTFSVTATNANGTSTATTSNSITATTVPQAPTIGTAADGGTGTTATVTYTANATGGAAVSTFTATSSPSGLTGTGASPITVSGLTTGTAYTFTVTATNANGTSTASAASNSVTPAIPPSFESIATIVPSGNPTSVTFSSIPGTYKSLQIRASAWTGTAISSNEILIRFNADSNSNYAFHYVQGVGSGTPTAQASTSQTSIEAGLMLGSPYAPAPNLIDIIDYASTTKNTTVRYLAGADGNLDAGSFRIRIGSGLWVSTAAITSITIIDKSGFGFASTSRFALYGIK